MTLSCKKCDRKAKDFLSKEIKNFVQRNAIDYYPVDMDQFLHPFVLHFGVPDYICVHVLSKFSFKLIVTSH